jgi:AcrR family transcriptional regulator
VARPKKNSLPTLDQTTIKTVAWQHIAESGLSALSLRAMARTMNISAPAIYHYFADRDALITALIVDAYTSLTRVLSDSRARHASQSITEQLRANCHAYRLWAVEHPNHYHLLFGQPLAGYTLPLPEVTPHVVGAFAVLVRIMDDINAAGRLNPRAYAHITRPPPPLFTQWQALTGLTDYRSLVAAQTLWTRVHGIVSAEISLNMPPIGLDYWIMYEHAVDQICADYILSP